MAKPRVKVAKKIKAGEPFLVKSLVAHKMESGQRKNKKTGKKIPRLIINRFEAQFNGEVVFSADWAPAISSNPYMAFYMKAAHSGDLVLTWTDDANETIEKKVKVKVQS
ncbi:MAG: thiosulfate oxidation carrier complex protein SoxZ [Gammaproteobacteria bacterium]|nr:thiosulfate oxidation carrier complex protein SoxZ [Gammaproteobacteria bacterium]